MTANARWFATPADCTPWKCIPEGHISEYPSQPEYCPRSGCGSRSFTPATIHDVRAESDRATRGARKPDTRFIT